MAETKAKDEKPTVESAQAKIAAGETLTAEENTLLRKRERDRALNVMAER